MGLFSFIKDAGSKLFNSEPEKTEKSRELVDAENSSTLTRQINNLKLSVENLKIVIEGDRAVVTGNVEDQATKEKIILIVGNNYGIAEVDDQMEVVNPEPEAKFYTVKKGDYLSKIAKEVYGNASKYNVIFEANKPMLKDPDLIYPGQVLRIPNLD
ncbi:MAG: peptidoglycan-binding protein LysM [Bacteroidota bacterium]